MNMPQVLKPNEEAGEKVDINIFTEDLMDLVKRQVTKEFPEFVTVWWEDREQTMIVDDNGHAKGLTYNNLATKVYHNATRQGRTGAPKDAEIPPIVGNALLLDIPKRQL